MFRITLFDDGREAWVTDKPSHAEAMQVVRDTDLWPGMEALVEWSKPDGTIVTESYRIDEES